MIWTQTLSNAAVRCLMQSNAAEHREMEMYLLSGAEVNKLKWQKSSHWTISQIRGLKARLIHQIYFLRPQ